MIMTIDDFNKSLLNHIAQRQECKDCPLYGKSTVGIDSSTGNLEKVDILFIGLNPGKDEVKNGLPFTGRAGKLLRAGIQSWSEGITWGIVNSMLCSTNNEAEIPDPEKALECCRGLVRTIAGHFNPYVYVPLGQKAMSMFGITDPITKASGQLFKEKIIPVIHPSALLRGGDATRMSLFHSSLKNVLVFAEKKKKGE